MFDVGLMRRLCLLGVVVRCVVGCWGFVIVFCVCWDYGNVKGVFVYVWNVDSSVFFNMW